MFGCKYIHVLVADDNERTREMTASLLNGAGINKVKSVADGEEAIDTIAWYPADLAIVDYNMGPIDGIEFTRYVRSSPLSPNPFLPIILMSSDLGARRVEAAYNAGVHDIVAKPVAVGALLLRLHALLASPRPFVRTATYFGPDRRAGGSAPAGPRRRATDRQASEIRAWLLAQAARPRGPGAVAGACGRPLERDGAGPSPLGYKGAPEPGRPAVDGFADRVR